jgi:Tfp pilus assembly protein PilX
MRANAMRTTSSSPSADRTRDRGTVLPLALVVSVVLSVVVVSIAGFVTTGLRYGKVVEDRADRLAAADGGMRYAVERLRLGASRICATSGGDAIDPPDINGATVTVRCGQVGDGFDDVNGWALILTGEEIPSTCSGGDCALIKTQSGSAKTKLVGGPVYMGSLEFDAQAPIEFRYSQLLHTESDCAASTAAVPPNVTFDSTSLGLACTERPWSADADPVAGLFSEPNIGVLPVNSGPALNPAPTIDGNGCKVFQPGYYTTAPVLGSHNYFRSGNYVFDGFNLEVKQAKVTAGRSAADGSDGAAQFIPNTTCNSARNADIGGITLAGVTFYLKNGAGFTLDAHGQLEIMRRKQGKSYVSIHVLDDSLTSTQNVIEQGPGTNKDMAIHGLVWAPEARITFSEVTNTANGQLLGGAVISNIDMRSSASAVGFIIAVAPSDLHGKLLLDSVAELDGKTTTIRSIVDYRPSTNYAAVTSWRVVE